MDLSIIITSFRRANLLQWNFSSLVKQTKNFNYEILVLNDGFEDNTKDVCQQYSSQLNIKYIFTGHRNKNGMQWRIPGYAINIGAKLAQGKNIIITCAEMYLLDNMLTEYISVLSKDKKALVITDGKDDRMGKFLEVLKSSNGNNYALYDSVSNGIHPLNTEYPFFLGVNKEEFISIGGYDEEFIGMCWDDLDIITRLKKNGCHLVKLPYRVMHLYHQRLRYGMQDVKDKWKYNESLFYKKINTIIRNEGKNWGVLENV